MGQREIQNIQFEEKRNARYVMFEPSLVFRVVRWNKESGILRVRPYPTNPSTREGKCGGFPETKQ